MCGEIAFKKTEKERELETVFQEAQVSDEWPREQKSTK